MHSPPDPLCNCALVIEQIELRLVRKRLITVFQASTHRADWIQHIVICLRASGVVGWGEVATLDEPYYVEETTSAAWAMLREHCPMLLGKSFANALEFRELYKNVKGYTFARAGLECAAWDALGQATQMPLSRMLGGSREEVFSGVAIGAHADAKLFDLIDRHVAEGYRRVKLKIAPGADLDLLEKVRQRYPNLTLMADANSAYSLRDLPHLRALDRFSLSMIEQPFAHDDFVEHAELQRHLTTPICLDESIRSLNDARTAIALGACRVINLKPGRVGGILEAKAIHDLCEGMGIPIWCGGMHEFGIGRAANVALSSLPNFSLPGDVSGFDKYFVDDFVDPPLRAFNGSIAVSSQPGIGVDVNLEQLDACTIQIETLRR
jgi:o-succinylbenzoate synthase